MESDHGGHGDQVPAAPGLVRGRGDDPHFAAFVSMWNVQYEVHQRRVRELQIDHTYDHVHVFDLDGFFSNGSHGDQGAPVPGLVRGRRDDLDFANFGSTQEEFGHRHEHVDEFYLDAFVSNEIAITSSSQEAGFEDGLWRWPEIFQAVELEPALDNTDEAYGQGMFGAVPAATAAVEALEVTKYKEGIYGSGSGVGNQKEEEEMCVICQDKLLEGVNVACMPCSHVFHEGCLFPWLERSRLCPLCRYGLPPADQN